MWWRCISCLHRTSFENRKSLRDGITVTTNSWNVKSVIRADNNPEHNRAISGHITRRSHSPCSDLAFVIERRNNQPGWDKGGVIYHRTAGALGVSEPRGRRGPLILREDDPSFNMLTRRGILTRKITQVRRYRRALGDLCLRRWGNASLSPSERKLTLWHWERAAKKKSENIELLINVKEYRARSVYYFCMTTWIWKL